MIPVWREALVYVCFGAWIFVCLFLAVWAFCDYPRIMREDKERMDAMRARRR